MDTSNLSLDKEITMTPECNYFTLFCTFEMQRYLLWKYCCKLLGNFHKPLDIYSLEPKINILFSAGLELSFTYCEIDLSYLF